MRFISASILIFLTSSFAFAQAPPNPFPIEGRLVRFGFDFAYPTIPGDLIGIAGSPVSAQNNGVIVALPSRNVMLNCAAGIYRAEVWSQSLNAWVPTAWSAAHTGYYPTDNFGHTWLDCGSTSAAVALAPLGILRCHGIDGNLVVPGDLQPGLNNGVLFSLWAQDTHIIVDAHVYHTRVLLGSYGYREAVYSVDLCDFDPQ